MVEIDAAANAAERRNCVVTNGDMLQNSVGDMLKRKILNTLDTKTHEHMNTLNARTQMARQDKTRNTDKT